MSWINTLNGRSELRDCRLQQQIKSIRDGYVYGPNDDVKRVNPIFINYLNNNKERIGQFRITAKGGLRDSGRGLTFYGGNRVWNNSTGKKGTWNSKDYSIIWDSEAPPKKETETKDLKPADSTTGENKPKGNIPPKSTTTHTATYTAPAGATGAFANYAWKTDKWGWNGNKKGTLNSTVASNLKLSGNATAEQAQQFLIDKGYNITKDNVWGKQSQAAYDDYMNKMIASKPADEALTGEKNNMPLSSPMQFKEAPTKPINMDALTNPKLNLHPGDKTALGMQIRDIKPQYKQYNRSETRDWLRMRNVNPYDLNGSDRRALRNYLSGDTTGKNYDINQLKGLSTKYNWGLKFQQGGQITMNEEQQMQQAFLQYLAEQTGAKSEQELEQVIQQLGEDGLKQAYTQFVQAMQQQQVQAAKFGAKLNYIKQLKGQCPQGMQMQYYKVGGRICKKCMAMEQKGGKAEEQGDVVEQFKKGRKKKCK